MTSKKTLQQLDYFSIIDAIKKYCVSEEGRHLIEKTLPTTNAHLIAQKKALTLSLMEELRDKKGVLLHAWGPVSGAIHTLKVAGAVVDREALWLLRTFCESAVAARGTLLSAALKGGMNCEPLSDSALMATYTLLKNSFNEDGTLRDNDAMASLKKRISDLTASLSAIFNRYISDSSLSDALEARVPVLHNNIETLAIKTAARKRVMGVVVGSSDSGKTTYIIPSDALENINDTMDARNALDEEAKKLVASICGEVTKNIGPLAQALLIMERLDAALAAALWGVANSCVMAQSVLDRHFQKTLNNNKNGGSSGAKKKAATNISATSDKVNESARGALEKDSFNNVNGSHLNEKRALKGDAFATTNLSGTAGAGRTCALFLLNARHPLISGAIPITVEIPLDKNILVITGANAGGKTVTLKTIALFAALNQAGFPIPCDSAALPIFDNIFIDIGDEQSISENLSTYTGHVKNLCYIVNHATKNTLCILDELGSGTDATEGAALAMAVLDEFRAQGTMTACSTHQAPIKNYAYTHKECLNAAVEFTDALSPTYKILLGVTGESHALDIAQKCGLNRYIVKRARNYITHKNADVSRLIAGLTQKNREAEKRLFELQQKEGALKEREERVIKSREKLDAERARLKSIQNETESQWLFEMRRKLEGLIREIRQGEITREKTLKAKSFIKDAEDAVLKREKEIEGNKGAKLLSDSNNSDSETGDTDMIARLKEHFLGTSNSDTTWRGDYSVEYANSDRGARPVFELRLLGLRREEAIAALERQLDLCISSNMEYFSVIHGKGNGVLQLAVKEVLDRYRKSIAALHYEYAPSEDGGAGKTYVYLR